MKRKLLATIILFLAMPIAALILQSCVVDDDCGGFPANGRVNSMRAFLHQKVDTLTFENRDTQILETQDYSVERSLEADLLAIWVEFSFDSSLAHFEGLSFVKRAMACSPPEYTAQIASVQITADQDFNGDYPAGTDLKPLFTILPQRLINEAMALTEFEGNGGELSDQYPAILVLNILPDNAFQGLLTMTVTTDNNETMEFELALNLIP